jgi:hypothetical protein
MNHHKIYSEICIPKSIIISRSNQCHIVESEVILGLHEDLVYLIILSRK